MTQPRHALTLGPLLFHWTPDQRADFYRKIADESPFDTVVLGEVVCSKRAVFDKDTPALIERLHRAGKDVVLASQALISTPAERQTLAELTARTDYLIEANDAAAVAALRGRPHTIGTLMNVYNEDTLAFLIDNGATRVCLPGELSGAAVKTLCAYAKAHHPTVAMEVFAFGRQPLAISARCYHARANGLHKEGCRFACGTDPDGLVVKTLDGDPFVAINGVQTMADRYTSLIEEIPTLQELGVTRFRLSPHTVDMVAVGCIFRDVIDARINPTEGAYRLSDLMPDASFSNGFLHGRAGKDLVLSE